MTLVIDERVVEKDDAVDLTVELNNLEVTVRAGTFRRKGVNHTLAEDIVHNAAIDATDPTYIVGYLVLNNGTPGVLVDEVVMDGIDESYLWDDPAIVFLRVLFNAKMVPAGTTDLADESVDFRVCKITKAE